VTRINRAHIKTRELELQRELSCCPRLTLVLFFSLRRILKVKKRPLRRLQNAPLSSKYYESFLLFSRVLLYAPFREKKKKKKKRTQRDHRSPKKASTRHKKQRTTNKRQRHDDRVVLFHTPTTTRVLTKDTTKVSLWFFLRWRLVLIRNGSQREK